MERRIAQRLSELRAGRGWTLDVLASRTGISRASLSRIERAELSPTAAMLAALCGQYGWTLSRLMAHAEAGPPSTVWASEQVVWTDPATGYTRRIVSPPHRNLKAEIAEISLPVGAVVSYDSTPHAGLEHHLWMLQGTLDLALGDETLRLKTGDCVRYILSGASRFACGGKRPAKYLIALVRP